MFIREEIFRNANSTIALAKLKNSKFNLNTLLNESIEYLAEALKDPMKVFPLGAYQQYTNKAWSVVGASYNPNRASYVNIKNLAKIEPAAKVVVYVRTNKVKQAVASVRARLLKKICNKDVVHGSCVGLSEKTLINLTEFDNILQEVVATDEYNLEKTMTLMKGLDRKNFFHLSYEELMGDLIHIDRLLLWAGANPKVLGWLSKPVEGKCKNGCTKNTSDDLREVLENYEMVESWITAHYPCLLPQFYETRAEAIQPDVETMCGHVLSDRKN